MESTEAAERCPGPPDGPYPVSEDWVWPHQWMPTVVMDLPELARYEGGKVRVIETCPACKQWRVVTYSRIQPPESAGNMPGNDPNSGG